MYDILNQQSFQSISRWYQDISRYSVDYLVILVGNKCDLVDDSSREVSSEAGENLAERFESLFFMECSAKTGENVETIVVRIALGLIHRFENAVAPVPPSVGVQNL